MHPWTNIFNIFLPKQMHQGQSKLTRKFSKQLVLIKQFIIWTNNVNDYNLLWPGKKWSFTILVQSLWISFFLGRIWEQMVPHHQMQMCIPKVVYIRHRFSYTLSTRFHQMANCLTFFSFNWDIVAQRSKIRSINVKKNANYVIFFLNQEMNY